MYMYICVHGHRYVDTRTYRMMVRSTPLLLVVASLRRVLAGQDQLRAGSGTGASPHHARGRGLRHELLFVKLHWVPYAAHTYRCTHIHTYVRTCVPTHVRTYSHTHNITHTHTYVYIYIRIYIYICIYIYIYVYIYMYMYIDIYIYVYIYIYTQMYACYPHIRCVGIYIYRYVYIHILLSEGLSWAMQRPSHTRSRGGLYHASRDNIELRSAVSNARRVMVPTRSVEDGSSLFYVCLLHLCLIPGINSTSLHRKHPGGYGMCLGELDRGPGKLEKLAVPPYSSNPCGKIRERPNMDLMGLSGSLGNLKRYGAVGL